jgi:ribonuclease HI
MKEFYTDGAGTLFPEEQKASICIVTKLEDKTTSETVQNLEGRVTSNEAEYEAIIVALQEAVDGDTIYTDSQLVVGQVTMGWKVRAGNLRALNERAKSLLAGKKVNIKWIPREKNLAGKKLEE